MKQEPILIFKLQAGIIDTDAEVEFVETMLTEEFGDFSIAEQNNGDRNFNLDDGKIMELSQQFKGRTRAAFGWGTMLTNDFRGLVPNDALAPFSLVCKAVAANGRPTVKLSDNPRKAMGPSDQIERYKRVFGVGDQKEEDVVV